MATKKTTTKKSAELRDQFLQCRVTQSFKEKFEAAAQKDRRTPGDLMRVLLEIHLENKN